MIIGFTRNNNEKLEHNIIVFYFAFIAWYVLLISSYNSRFPTYFQQINGVWQDVHGAGSQKSDVMVGNPANFPDGRGPQGDAVRIYNYVRLVRDI